MSEKTSSNLIAQWGTKILCVLWALWVIIEYTSYHPYLTQAIINPPYGKVMVVLAVLAFSLVGYALIKKKIQAGQGWTIHYRGIYLYLIVLLLSTILIALFSSDRNLLKENIPARLGYFVVFSTSLLAMASIVFTSANNLGDLVLVRFKKIYHHNYTLISVALGISIVTMVLFFLGLFNALHPIVVGLLLAASLIARYKSTWSFIHRILFKKYNYSINHWWTIPVFTILFLTTAIAWIGALKAYPTGFDGSSLYMNTTKLIADSHGLIAGGQAYNWSIFMSLGQTVFQSETVSILLSHLMGVWCLFFIYGIAKLFLDKEYALLAAVITFISPYYCFHTMIDEKVDLGFLFVALGCLTLILQPWLNRSKEHLILLNSSFSNRFTKLTHEHTIWLLAGWLCGFAFGIKYTAFFLFIAIVCTLFHYYLGKKGFISIFLLSLGALFLLQIYRFSSFEMSIRSAMIFGGAIVIISLAALFYLHKSNLTALKQPIIRSVMFLTTFIIAFAPWTLKNINEHGSVKAQHFIKGENIKPEVIIAPEYKSQGGYGILNQAPDIKRKNVNPFPTVQFIFDQQNKPNQNTQKSKKDKSIKSLTKREELRRYFGYEVGVWPFISLPYDLTNNTNIPHQRYLDFGFLFLLFLPLLLFSGSGTTKGLIKNISIIIGLSIWVALTYLTLAFKTIPGFSANTFMNSRSSFFASHPGGDDSILFSLHALFVKPISAISQLLEPQYSVGNHIKGPLVVICLLLIAIGLYFLSKKRIQQMSRPMRLLTGFIFTYLFLWTIMGSGILWYGFPIWPLLVIVIIYYFNHAHLFINPCSKRFSTHFYGVCLALFMAGSTAVFFSNPKGSGKSVALYSWPFIDYITNAKTDKLDVLKYYNTAYPHTLKIINNNKSGKIYKANTFLGYHIDRNNERVYSDDNLGLFDGITKQISADHLFFDVLKDNKFEYILYALNTASIDKTPEQSLRKKADRFIKLLTQSNKVELVSTDNYIDNPSGPFIKLSNGKQIRAKQGLNGSTVKRGSYVLFKIR